MTRGVLLKPKSGKAAPNAREESKQRFSILWSRLLVIFEQNKLVYFLLIQSQNAVEAVVEQLVHDVFNCSQPALEKTDPTVHMPYPVSLTLAFVVVATSELWLSEGVEMMVKQSQLKVVLPKLLKLPQTPCRCDTGKIRNFCRQFN